VRWALRRLAHAGELLECLSASFHGLRNSCPTYMVLCLPLTLLAHYDDDIYNECDEADSKTIVHEPSLPCSTPPHCSASHPPLPPASSHSHHAQQRVLRTPSLVVPSSASSWSMLGRVRGKREEEAQE